MTQRGFNLPPHIVAALRPGQQVQKDTAQQRTQLLEHGVHRTLLNQVYLLTKLQQRLARHEDRERKIAECKRQLEQRERALENRPHDNGTSARSRERVKVLEKPPGEAGDKKRGFQLQKSMGSGDTEEGNLKYNQFLATNRRNAIRAGIDFERTYNKQKPETLAKLFKLNRMAIPYLTRERFPNDWPQIEALKQFVRNARRGVARKSRKCTVEARNDSGHDSDSSVGERDTPNVVATPTILTRMVLDHLGCVP
ncbi:hypothetical protein HGRIS_003277 [Hohenbuehelia grisea]|uniref:Uncharacterized protein n=1 Tax=Hohenbuehelia grisea TaxID=104357 RepID=A0ABR3JMY7_9AGAR